jgi:hypothetical protein
VRFYVVLSVKSAVKVEGIFMTSLGWVTKMREHRKSRGIRIFGKGLLAGKCSALSGRQFMNRSKS